MIGSTDHPAVVVNPFAIHLGALAIAQLVQRLLPPHLLPVAAYRVLGTADFLIGLAFGLLAARAMRAARTSLNPSRPTTALITRGPYARSRNPIYIAMLLNYAGLSLFLGSLWGLLLPAVVVLMTVWVIRPEERCLEDRFGAGYSAYNAAVPRWV
jgi:protein-S-isoprenylcysteine O-methyltransferase Ste14